MRVVYLDYSELTGDGAAVVIGDTDVSRKLGTPGHQIHIVHFNVRDNEWRCSCQRFWYAKEECKHIKAVKRELERLRGGG